MFELKVKQNKFDVILFVAQVVIVYIVICVSLYNLTRGSDLKELWISLLSSSVGYILPSPMLKNVPDST